MEDCQEWSECGDLFSRVARRLPGLRFEDFVGRVSDAPPGTAALPKHHLCPARQTGGNGAKVIAACNRNARQLFRQRFLDQR